MRALLTLFLGWLLCATVMLTPAASQTGKRVALVIGNSDYKHTTPLPNPRNDAEDLSKALKRLGFEVVEGRDLDWRGMKVQLEKFARLAQGADAALAFYAGHGLQHQGENYLVPVDAKLEDEIGLDFQTVRVDDIVRALDRARGVKLLILDACRNLPLAGGKDSSQVFQSKGLAKIGRRGMVVAYATQADDVAYDGSGRNSFFTGALVNTIEEPGLEVGPLFRKVAASVSQQTGGKQTPELSLSLTGEFYFNRGETDRNVWQRVRGSSDKAALQDFITRFPTSDFADAARAQIEVLEMRAQTDTRRRTADAAAAQQKVDSERQARARDDEQKRKADEERVLRLQQAEETAAKERAEEARVARVREEEQQRRKEELAAQEKAERERLAWARLEEEQKRRSEEAARERAEQERLAWARLEEEQKRRIEEQAARQRGEQERLAQARAEEENRQRAEQQRIARVRQEEETRQRLEQELIAKAREEEGRQKSEQERVARARQEEETRQRLEQERIARLREEEGRQKAEQERVARVRQEEEAARQRIETARREEERLKAEQERVARVRQEEEAARQRIETARREEERLKAEQERVAAARLEQERQRRAEETAERERVAQAASEAQLKAAEKPRPDEPIVVARLPGPEGQERRIVMPEAKPDPVDTPELIEKAQKELLRLGCYVGRVDGKLRPTRDALARYYEQLRKPGSPPITAGLIEELEERQGRLCPLECDAGERPQGNTCVAIPKDTKPQPTARPKAKEQPERAVARPARTQREPVAAAPSRERPIARPAPAPARERQIARPAPAPAPAPSQAAAPARRPGANTIGIGF